ncbi:MAG TPA: hypothetical protein VF529_15625 [Solirubrobacteraceae bacterium]|jgi:hypothetical protein
MLVAAAAVAAPAAAAPLVGISDQSPAVLGSEAYARTGSRIARVVVPWDSGATPPAWVVEWLDVARARGIEPLVTFGRRRDDPCPGRACVPPTIAAYASATAAFRERFSWVRNYVPWNEPNHPDEPTVDKPALVAGYFNVLRAGCPECTVVAGDVLDADDVASWVGEFSRELDTSPAVWGLHNYRGVNAFSDASTQAFLRMVRGPVWLTETGGIVRLLRSDASVAIGYDEQRAADVLSMTLDLAAARSDRIARVYVYNWVAGGPDDTFDSGLTRPDGSARPGLGVVLERLGVPEEPVLEALPVDPPAQLGDPAPPGGDTPPAAEEHARPRLRVARERLRRGRSLVLRLSCFGAASCPAIVELRGLPHPGAPSTAPLRASTSRGVAIARRRVLVPAGATRTRRFRLTARGVRWLRRMRPAARVAALVRPVPGGRVAVEPQLTALTVGRYGSATRTKRGR